MEGQTDGWTDGRMDGRVLFYRTFLAEAWDPIKEVYIMMMDLQFLGT